MFFFKTRATPAAICLQQTLFCSRTCNLCCHSALLTHCPKQEQMCNFLCQILQSFFVHRILIYSIILLHFAYSSHEGLIKASIVSFQFQNYFFSSVYTYCTYSRPRIIINLVASGIEFRFYNVVVYKIIQKLIPYFICQTLSYFSIGL